MPDPELEWLVADLEHRLSLKIDTTEVQARIAAAHADLEPLESDLRLLFSRIRAIVGANEFSLGLSDLLNRKITTAAVESRVATQISQLETIGSDYLQFTGRLRALEQGMAIYFSQSG